MKERWQPKDLGSELEWFRGAIVHETNITLKGKYGNHTISFKKGKNPGEGNQKKFFRESLKAMHYVPSPPGPARVWPQSLSEDPY